MDNFTKTRENHHKRDRLDDGHLCNLGQETQSQIQVQRRHRISGTNRPPGQKTVLLNAVSILQYFQSVIHDIRCNKPRTNH